MPKTDPGWFEESYRCECGQLLLFTADFDHNLCRCGNEYDVCPTCHGRHHAWSCVTCDDRGVVRVDRGAEDNETEESDV